MYTYMYGVLEKLPEGTMNLERRKEPRTSMPLNQNVMLCSIRILKRLRDPNPISPIERKYFMTMLTHLLHEARMSND